MITDAHNEEGDLARAMGVTPRTGAFQERARAELERDDGPKCVCGRPVDRVHLPATGLVRVCLSGDHVLVGSGDATRVYVYVENPGDVIEAVGQEQI